MTETGEIASAAGAVLLPSSSGNIIVVYAALTVADVKPEDLAIATQIRALSDLDPRRLD